MTAVVHVEPKVEAGLNRGGEDLHLVFTSEVEGDTPPTEFVADLAVGDDLEGCNLDRLDKEAEARFLNDEDDGYDGPVRYWTRHYEHEWVGTPESALALAEAKLRDPVNWRFCHRPGESPRLCFEYEHYVTGNAD